MRKQLLPPGLVEFQQVKEKRSLYRQDAGKQFLTNLIYMRPLREVLRMIIPFYWNPGKTIIDVTAGKKISWEAFPYNHLSSCGFEHWHVDFNDIDQNKDADYHVPAQEIDSLGKHWDILFNDFPFTELKNGVESFGTKAKKRTHAMEKNHNQEFRREFYFDNFTPLDELFPQCVKAWNKVTDNLIIKIGDSHKEKQLLENHVYAINAFDHKLNPKSDFKLVDCIHYRGIYSSRGGRFPFAQSVTSYYLIFKKDVNAR